MRRDHLEHALDLHSADIDPEMFAAALAVQHIRRLIVNGGSEFGRLDLDAAFYPQDLERFLARAVETVQRIKRFEHEWRRLQQTFPPMKEAWEKGQVLFQEALSRATDNQEDMEYLSQIDFAVECYASVSAWNTYPHDLALQNWAINGYMLAWRHFFTDENITE